MTSGGPKPRIPEFLHPIRFTERGYRRKVRILIIYDSDHPYGHPLRILIIMAKHNQVQEQNVILRSKRNYMYRPAFDARNTSKLRGILYIIYLCTFAGETLYFLSMNF